MKKTAMWCVLAALVAAALPFSVLAQEPACEWTILDRDGTILNTGGAGGDGNLTLTAGAELSDDVPTVNTGGQALRLPEGSQTAAAESADWFDPLSAAERFTIMAWVRRESADTSSNQSARIFSDIDTRGNVANGVEFRFAGAGGQLTLRINGSEVSTSSGIPPDNGTWHHVAVVYDGTLESTGPKKVKNAWFYIDGVQVGLGNNLEGLVVEPNGVPVTLGNSSAGRVAANLMVGSIDDVFVFPGWAPEPSGNGNLNLAIRNWMLVDDLDRIPEEEDEPEPEEDHLVPPVVVEDVVAQTIGIEREYEDLEPGLIFVDAASGELCYVNEANPKGRTVCVCKDFPDWHSFTNTVRLNGNKLQFNPFYSIMAEAHALSARYGTQTVWSVVGMESGDLAGMVVSMADENTLMISVNSVGEGVTLQVCTNLMEATPWRTATNAVVVEETDIAITWRVSLMMDQMGAELYRVLDNGASVAAGFHVFPELHPRGGIEMGGETWTNWPDMANYATNGAVDAVAGDLAAHKAANNPHGITAATIGALTVETDAMAMSAVNTASNALANRIGAAETNAQNFATRDWTAGYMATNHQSLDAYATEEWVVEQGFLTEHQSLDAYATTASVSAVSGRVSTIESDYVTSADISDFATNGTVASLERRVEALEGSSLYLTEDYTMSSNNTYASIGLDTSTNNVTLTLSPQDSFQTVIVRKFSNLNTAYIVGTTTNAMTFDGQVLIFDYWPEMTNWYWRAY